MCIRDRFNAQITMTVISGRKKKKKEEEENEDDDEENEEDEEEKKKTINKRRKRRPKNKNENSTQAGTMPSDTNPTHHPTRLEKTDNSVPLL